MNLITELERDMEDVRSRAIEGALRSKCWKRMKAPMPGSRTEAFHWVLEKWFNLAFR